MAIASRGPILIIDKQAILKKGRATPFIYRHPWVFSGAVKSLRGDIHDGDAVALHSHEGEFIAWGLYNSQSQILLRLYSWKMNEPFDDTLLKRRIRDAVNLRRELFPSDSEDHACRLVFSEGDNISGLIVDRYGPILSIQINSLALMQRLDSITGILAGECAPAGIILKNEDEIRSQEGIIRGNGPVYGAYPESGSTIINEYGINFEVDITGGQKTGFYLDQRENRKTAALYGRGRDILDICCYTGGFSIHAAKSGAKSVTAVDNSQPAVHKAETNARLNNVQSIKFIKNDMFKFLGNIPSGTEYGMAILDPPRFAQTNNTVEQALKGYARLNSLAVRILKPGGILVTCSCSGRVSEEQFIRAVLEGAMMNNRFMQILEIRPQASDHPVSLHCPETRYLKCLICRVM